jgi:NTE family protein
MTNSASLAVVIGSGGVKCAAALGLWKVLQQHGIQVSMAVGSSGGSIYAGVMALGYDLDNAREMTYHFWSSDLMQGYTSNLRAALTGESRFTQRSGLIDDAPTMDRLRRTFKDLTFQDAHIPLYMVSTDLYSGEAVVLSRGKLVDAVRASIAIPMLYSPWEIDERLLVDGAVSDPLPVDVAIREGASIILAMGFEVPTRSRMRSYTAVTAHFNSLYMNNILKSTYAFYNAAHHAEIIPILPQFERAIGAFDVHMIPEIIAAGEQSARQQIPYLRRLLAA